MAWTMSTLTLRWPKNNELSSGNTTIDHIHTASIVLTSSIAGIKGTPGISAYTASKHAVVGITRTAALECADDNIRINAVNPAPIETRMMRSLEEQSMPDSPEEAKQIRMRRIPLQRYGTPEEVANLMLFLASDESQYCTGGVYMVDGGISAA